MFVHSAFVEPTINFFLVRIFSISRQNNFTKDFSRSSSYGCRGTETFHRLDREIFPVQCDLLMYATRISSFVPRSPHSPKRTSGRGKELVSDKFSP